MDILNPKSLRKQANLSLRRGREPKKLIYTYAGISLAISVVLYLANLWLDDQISGTGGLGNIGTRAIFSTAQQVLPILSGMVVMCLDMGFLGGLMRISRGQYADHTDLKVGFRKFWPLVRLSIIQTMLYISITILAFQLGSLLFTFTPWAGPVIEVVIPQFQANGGIMDEAMVMEALGYMVPMLVIVLITFLVILVPFLHRMRMAQFCLLEDPSGRALAAIRESSRMMRRRLGQMIKIDLSLWLYYIATAVVVLVLWLDVIFAILEIPLPMNANLFAMVLYGVSLALQFAVHVFLRPTADMTYLTVYNSLKEKPQDDGVVLGNIFDM